MELTSAILDSVKNGYPIVVVDDKDRENEGDLIGAAGMLRRVPCRAFAHEHGLVCCTINDILALVAQIQPQLPRSDTPLVKAKIISFDTPCDKTPR